MGGTPRIHILGPPRTRSVCKISRITCLTHIVIQERQVEIGRRMGGVDYTWVSRLRAALHREMQRDAGLRNIFQKVERAILTHE